MMKQQFAFVSMAVIVILVCGCAGTSRIAVPSQDDLDSTSYPDSSPSSSRSHDGTAQRYRYATFSETRHGVQELPGNQADPALSPLGQIMPAIQRRTLESFYSTTRDQELECVLATVDSLIRTPGSGATRPFGYVLRGTVMGYNNEWSGLIYTHEIALNMLSEYQPESGPTQTRLRLQQPENDFITQDSGEEADLRLLRAAVLMFHDHQNLVQHAYEFDALYVARLGVPIYSRRWGHRSSLALAQFEHRYQLPAALPRFPLTTDSKSELKYTILYNLVLASFITMDLYRLEKYAPLLTATHHTDLTDSSTTLFLCVVDVVMSSELLRPDQRLIYDLPTKLEAIH